MTVEDTHTKKELRVKRKILDFMGSTELITNFFRISQAEEKLKNDLVLGVEQATVKHFAKVVAL